MSVELKRRGFREWLLWHVFGLIPYRIWLKGDDIIFYATMKNSQKLDRTIIARLNEKLNATSN